MEIFYGNKDISDVTINLIPSSTLSSTLGESGDTNTKRKKITRSIERPLATLNLHSERLCLYSKYFQILLDQRWSNSNTKSLMKFSLEVHTDVKYYEDCFSRMYASYFKGILSVDHALELLKVASQIDFAELMDAIVCYLSLVPWSKIEETKIHKFPFSTYISSSGLSDLNERLQHKSNVYEVGQDYLSSNLEIALDSVATSKTAQPTSCEMFEIAFSDILESPSCYILAKDTLDLVNRKGKELLQKIVVVGEDFDALESNFRMLCWLLEILLNARGAKELVEHMLLISDLSSHLSLIFNNRAAELFKDFEWTFKWTHTMLSIFNEVLAGHLLLKSSMRVDLFHKWEWLFKALFLNRKNDEVLATKLARTLSSFMMTLPHKYQTTMLKGWLHQVDNVDTCMLEVLILAHPMWIKGLKRSLVAHESIRASEIATKAQSS